VECMFPLNKGGSVHEFMLTSYKEYNIEREVTQPLKKLSLRRSGVRETYPLRGGARCLIMA